MSIANAVSANTPRSIDIDDFHEESVAVVSESTTDAHLISDILRRTGYKSYRVSLNAQSRVESTNRTDLNNECIATILCIRKSSPTPYQVLQNTLPGQRIIVLSDCEREQTVVSLLDSGADYFFDIREPDSLLQARLEAALRFNTEITNRSFTVDEFHFDARRRVVSRLGEAVNLSPKEFDFAYYLFSNLDRIIYNSELMTSVWSLPSTMETRRLDTAACRLRKKLLFDSKHGWQLKRIRSIGFRMKRLHKNDEEFSYSSLLNMAMV